MEQMATVLGRLSEIEAAAVNIENEAANEKRRIAREYEQKTIDFDQKLDAQTEGEGDEEGSDGTESSDGEEDDGTESSEYDEDYDRPYADTADAEFMEE